MSDSVKRSFSILPNGTTATTQSSGDNSTKLATTAYVNTATVTTQNSYTASGRVIGTPYHNTTGKTMTVIVSIYYATGQNVYGKSDSSSSPTVVQSQSYGIGATSLAILTVLNNNYYVVITDSGGGTIYSWEESY